MEFYHQGHCTYYTRYHLILSSKYRRKIFNPGIPAYFREAIQQIRDYYPYLVIFEINTDQDHARILISIPPKIAVSKAVNIIKSNTATAMKKKFPEFFKKAYWGTDGIWSDGYFTSTVGANEKVIKQNIEMQGREDSGQAKLV